MTWHHRARCTICGSAELTEIVDLGMHPLADTFVPESCRYDCDKIYPLICDLCPACGQVQLRTITDPEERYSHVDYSYTSSNSRTSRAHWEIFAADVPARTGLREGDRVVEIGSNDGFLSAELGRRGYRVLGVDPSEAMCALAAERGVQTVPALFTHKLAREIAEAERPLPRLVVANNVVNHANDPADFARGVRDLLAPGGTFVFELPYWLRTVADGKFDQIYHEHVTYFTVRSARALFAAAGMSVIHAEEVEYHGGSIRIFVRHAAEVAPTARVAELIGREETLGLFSVDTYNAFMARVQAARDRFMARVFELRREGARIVCVGAAAKANTFLTYYGLNASLVDCVTDASPTKIGKRTPGTRIPIAPDNALAGRERAHVIVTSWNLAEVLRPALLAINPELEFLNPYEAA